MAHAQDNTNLVTKGHFTISVALNLLHLLGLHDALSCTFSPLDSNSACGGLHSQRAYSCRYIHKTITRSYVDL
jgi:hypothetical protein